MSFDADDVPTGSTREGRYAERVIAIEPGGIEHISEDQRHGRPLDLFWTWMSPNFEFATVFVGCIGVIGFGGSFGTVVKGVLLGTALGATAVAALSALAPAAGVPQMVYGRAAFGYKGNMIPTFLMLFTAGIGWFAVNTTSGALALAAFAEVSYRRALVIVVVTQGIVAFFGYNFVHVFARYVFPLLAVVFIITVGAIFAHADLTSPGQGSQMTAFMLTAASAFGYAGGWSPYSGDYARYLPSKTDRRTVALAAGLGVFVPCVVLEVAGAALTTIAGTRWGPTDSPVSQLALAVPGSLFKLALLGISLGAISANVLNIYSGAMSFLTLGINIPGRLRRAIMTVVCSSLGCLPALNGNNGPGSRYEGFLLLVSYWIAPWLGVVITDMRLRTSLGMRCYVYDPSHTSSGGTAAFIVALVLSVGLFSSQPLYTGPVSRVLPKTGDLTPVVGFILAAVLYRCLFRGPAVQEARQE